MTPRPSVVKKELKRAKKEMAELKGALAFSKKQSEAYALAIMALADDNKVLKDIVALSIAALRDAVGPDVIDRIRAGFDKRPSSHTLGPQVMESIITTVNEVLDSRKSSITPEVAVQMAKDAQEGPDEPAGGVQASRPTGKPLKGHCNNGLQCIQTFPKGVVHKPSCICLCGVCRP
jgi:hypothetical protein